MDVLDEVDNLSGTALDGPSSKEPLTSLGHSPYNTSILWLSCSVATIINQRSKTRAPGRTGATRGSLCTPTPQKKNQSFFHPVTSCHPATYNQPPAQNTRHSTRSASVPCYNAFATVFSVRLSPPSAALGGRRRGRKHLHGGRSEASLQSA